MHRSLSYCNDTPFEVEHVKIYEADFYFTGLFYYVDRTTDLNSINYTYYLFFVLIINFNNIML